MLESKATIDEENEIIDIEIGMTENALKWGYGIILGIGIPVILIFLYLIAKALNLV